MKKREPSPLRDLFGINVRVARVRARKTLETLAHDVGTTPSYLSRVERGLVAPSIDVVDRIARALAVSPASLLSEPP